MSMNDIHVFIFDRASQPNCILNMIGFLKRNEMYPDSLLFESFCKITGGRRNNNDFIATFFKRFQNHSANYLAARNFTANNYMRYFHSFVPLTLIGIEHTPKIHKAPWKSFSEISMSSSSSSAKGVVPVAVLKAFPNFEG